MTQILDTTSSDTGTVISFSDSDKREPQTVVISLQVGSGDVLTLYTKIGAESLKATETYAATEDITFVALPDQIRIDRTTDGGSADSSAYISQVS